ncbi:MAG: ATP-binding protein [Lachnospiraceae bacterium]|nr:ATP-binding protein [Lachnospiraceae bacterium]
MKPINIYALTRLKNPELMSRMERQMSGRERYLNIREWEMEGLELLCERLQPVCRDAFALTFYYSFTMQKLGKEFDLIRIGEGQIVNIELKSGNVSDEAIRAQLIQNRYYLNTLGRPVHFYTYISGQDRLVRLTGSGRLACSTFEELGALLERQESIYQGDIEDLFKEEKYLISPITDPARFLRKEYFLTFQQRDIKKQILKNIEEGHLLQGFTGLPGTGKTILLYDIAMTLSGKNPVCIFHFGSHREELRQLDERLKRIDFYYCDKNTVPEVSKDYSAILVDEGHSMGAQAFGQIRALGTAFFAPIIISYDNVECVSEAERAGIGAPVFEACEDYRGFKLTNKIRLNNELSAFLRTLFCASRPHRRDYPNVSVSYGGDAKEAENLIRYYEKEGYLFLSGPVPSTEFNRVVMLLDESFYYDGKGFLRNRESDAGGETERIMNLFHGLSRAKERIALVIRGNLKLTEQIYCILQGKSEKHS